MSFTTLELRGTKRSLYSKLAAIAREAYRNAYPPFSDFKVGVAALLWDGRVYLGVNSENPGLDLTIHGEMSAVNAAIADGAILEAEAAGLDQFSFIKAVAVVCERAFEAWPCGHCRDYLSGFGQTMDIIVPKQSGEVLWRPLSRILPHAPNARQLIDLTRSGRLVESAQWKDLFLTTLADWQGPSIKTQLPALGRKAAVDKHLLDLAKSAAIVSYAPYSKRPAGAAVLLYDNSIYVGARVENVGYTLSSQPEQSAIQAAIADGAARRAAAAGVRPDQFIKTIAYAPYGQPNTWPNGTSRQWLCEWGLKFDIIVEGANGEVFHRKLAQLLPGAFVPDVLSYWTQAQQ